MSYSMSSNCRACGWPMHSGLYCARCQKGLRLEIEALRWCEQHSATVDFRHDVGRLRVRVTIGGHPFDERYSLTEAVEAHAQITERRELDWRDPASQPSPTENAQ